MIEIVENAIQIFVLLICSGLSAAWAIRSRGTRAFLLFIFYASYALADLFSVLYLVFYDETPSVFYVSDLSWYACYIYLLLILQTLADPGVRTVRHPALWLLPAFCVAMCVFYMQWGDYPGNIACAVLMSLLLFHAVRGLMYEHAHPRKPSSRMFCICILVFCVMEYALWTASCFWSGQTWENPYFLLDCGMTVCLAFFLPAYRKAVK